MLFARREFIVFVVLLNVIRLSRRIFARLDSFPNATSSFLWITIAIVVVFLLRKDDREDADRGGRNRYGENRKDENVRSEHIKLFVEIKKKLRDKRAHESNGA